MSFVRTMESRAAKYTRVHRLTDHLLSSVITRQGKHSTASNIARRIEIQIVDRVHVCSEELCSQTWTERPSTRTIQVLSKSMWTMLECSDVRRKSFPLYAASFFKTDITISNAFIQTTNRQHAMAKISVSLFGTFGQLLPIQHGTNNLFYNHYFYLI